VGCTKASFVCFYLRIFSVNKRSYTHYLLVGVLVLVIIWTLAFFFSELFQCGLNFWAVNSSVLDLATQCPHTQILDIAVCSSDVATDLVIFAIPIPLVRISASNKRVSPNETRFGASIYPLPRSWPSVQSSYSEECKSPTLLPCLF
jgi:hypothetical protein